MVEEMRVKELERRLSTGAAPVSATEIPLPTLASSFQYPRFTLHTHSGLNLASGTSLAGQGSPQSPTCQSSPSTSNKLTHY